MSMHMACACARVYTRRLLLHVSKYPFYLLSYLLTYFCTQLERKAIRETGRPVKQIVEGFRY